MKVFGNLGWVVVLSAALSGASEAATFVVDDAGTTSDANFGDGTCADDMGRCTWRAAAQEANTLAGADVIALPAGTYAGISVTLSDDVEVVGAGASASILDGEDARSILYVDSGTVIIRGVHFMRGAASSGAAISNFGTLTVRDCAFTANVATDLGGAIDSGGALTIERSTFTGNEATAGGAIFVDNDTATIRESTLDGNVGGGNASGIHAQNLTMLTLENATVANGVGGPGIVVASTASATLRHVTITGHERIGLTVFSPASATVANTVIAGNSLGPSFEDECFVGGTYVSLGGNLSSDSTCNLLAATDLQDTDPMLGTLGDNGGPTFTVALLGGSPAIDTGLGTECLSTDQRGVSRPVGSQCDRGAFESGGVVPSTTTTTFPTTTTSTTSTSTSTTTSTTSSTSSSTSTSSSSSTTSTTSTSSSSTSTSSSTTSTSSSTSSTLPTTTTTVPGSTTTSTTSSSTSSTSTSIVTTTTIVATTTTTTTLPASALFPFGKKLVVRTKASGAQTVQVIATGAVEIPAACDVAGALTIQASGTPGSIFPLNADLWRPLKAKKPEWGCKYRKGPVVVKVKVKTGKGFKIVVKGDDLGVALTTDPRPVRIELRHGDVRHCLEFGGDAGKHVPDEKLVAKRASAASACPGD